MQAAARSSGRVLVERSAERLGESGPGRGDDHCFAHGHLYRPPMKAVVGRRPGRATVDGGNSHLRCDDARTVCGRCRPRPILAHSPRSWGLGEEGEAWSVTSTERPRARPPDPPRSRPSRRGERPSGRSATPAARACSRWATASGSAARAASCARAWTPSEREECLAPRRQDARGTIGFSYPSGSLGALARGFSVHGVRAQHGV